MMPSSLAVATPTVAPEPDVTLGAKGAQPFNFVTFAVRLDR
jgi:hypothetical protein